MNKLLKYAKVCRETGEVLGYCEFPRFDPPAPKGDDSPLVLIPRVGNWVSADLSGYYWNFSQEKWEEKIPVTLEASRDFYRVGDSFSGIVKDSQGTIIEGAKFLVDGVFSEGNLLPKDGFINIKVTGIYGGGCSVWVSASEEKSQERQGKKINQEKGSSLQEGFLWGGYRWDCDLPAQVNITAVVSAINAGIPLPKRFFWTSFDNQDVELTGEEMKSLGAAMLGHVHSAHAVARGKKKALEGERNAS